MASFEEAAAEVVKTATDTFHTLEQKHTVSVRKSAV